MRILIVYVLACSCGGGDVVRFVADAQMQVEAVVSTNGGRVQVCFFPMLTRVPVATDNVDSTRRQSFMTRT